MATGVIKHDVAASPVVMKAPRSSKSNGAAHAPKAGWTAEKSAFNVYETALASLNQPVILVNRDFVVTQINRGTRRLLETHLDDFKKIYPGFSIDGVVGTAIDRFHRDPAHQRRLLSDPANLPYQADIKVGGLIFALTVGGIFDTAGKLDTT